MRLRIAVLCHHLRVPEYFYLGKYRQPVIVYRDTRRILVGQVLDQSSLFESLKAAFYPQFRD